MNLPNSKQEKPQKLVLTKHSFALFQKCSWLPNTARLACTDMLWRGFPPPILFPASLPKNPDLFFQHTRAADFSQSFVTLLQTAMLLKPEQLKFYNFIITRLYCIASLFYISAFTNMHSHFYIPLLAQCRIKEMHEPTRFKKLAN